MTKRNAVAFEAKTGDENSLPGAYRFTENGSGEIVGMTHGCPCGCGSQGFMWFEGKADAGGQEWSVEGEWPKVTLRPSIGFGMDRTTGQYHWHGFLNNGVFEEC